MKLSITINAVITLAIVSCVPDGADLLSIGSLIFANIALHYRALGGRWSDDWERSTVNPNYFKSKEYRIMMDGHCFSYRASLIMAVLLLAGALIQGFGLPEILQQMRAAL